MTRIARSPRDPIFAAIVCIVCGCTGSTELPPGPKLAASASASAGPSVGARPIAPDVRRVLARAIETHDPVDLTELASTAGARRLTDLFDDPTTRATAVAAIGYAADAEVAYARMASEARARPGADAEALLDAFARSLERTSKRGEILDDEGTHSAVGDLQALAKDTSRTESERSLARTILRRLSAKGFVDASQIPAE